MAKTVTRAWPGNFIGQKYLSEWVDQDMSVPLVSVVIPAYNAARTLEATIKSVLAQTVQDFEIIIVDDGSKDDTLSVALSLSDARVKVIAQSNGGASAARNTGIKAARGKYVALLDADDLWLPYKLERQLTILEAGSGVFAVQSGAIFVDDSLNILSVRPCIESQDVLLDTLFFQNMPNNMSTLVIARHKFDEMGHFDCELEILEEWDMAIKVARYCNLVSIEEPLSLYRVHSGNRSRNVDIHIKPGLQVLQRLFSDPTLPDIIHTKRHRVYATFYRMLAGGYFNHKHYFQFLKWAAVSLRTDPSQIGYMAQLPWRKWKRLRSRQLGLNKSLRAPNKKTQGL